MIDEKTNIAVTDALGKIRGRNGRQEAVSPQLRDEDAEDARLAHLVFAQKRKDSKADWKATKDTVLEGNGWQNVAARRRNKRKENSRLHLFTRVKKQE